MAGREQPAWFALVVWAGQAIALAGSTTAPAAELTVGSVRRTFNGMNRRIRLLGSLVTLVVLSAFLVESARASMCLPGTSMTAAGADAKPHPDMDHGPADDSRAPHTDMAGCPLGMAGMGGTCVVMLMPMTTPATTATSEAEGVGIPPVSNLHDLLISAARFRPPRP